MSPLRILSCALAAIALHACNQTSSEVGDPLPFPVDSLSAKARQTDYIFDDDTVRRYDLLLSPESLAIIDANPIQEQSVEGALVVDGDTMSRVGIRYKGKEGAWYACVEKGPWGGGPKTCPLGMQIKINRVNKDTTFHGLKTFQLHAMSEDPSKLVQRIGYWFYRQMGVPAPRVVHAELWINGVYEGLFAHVEEIDGRFARYHFREGTGNLYKEVWPLLYTGKAQPQAAFEAGLKTNESAPSVGMMLAFAQRLEVAPNLDSIRGAIRSRMDLDEALSMVAVSYSLDDDDGAFHWYAEDAVSPQKSRPHNFYWYEEPAAGKLHLIPWDDDKMLQRVANPDTMSALELRDGWGDTSHNCQNYGWEWRQRSAACDKLVQGLASYPAEYRAKLVKLNDGPFVAIDPVLQKWERQLRAVVERNQDRNVNAISLGEWQAGVVATRAELAAAKSALGRQVGK